MALNESIKTYRITLHVPYQYNRFKIFLLSSKIYNLVGGIATYMFAEETIMSKLFSGSNQNQVFKYCLTSCERFTAIERRMSEVSKSRALFLLKNAIVLIRQTHCWVNTIIRLNCLYNRNCCAGKTVSLSKIVKSQSFIKCNCAVSNWSSNYWFVWPAIINA